MSAIAGYIDLGGRVPPDMACRAILSSLVSFGRDRQGYRRLGNATFGHALCRMLPEDDHDDQPLIGAGKTCLIAGDIRIDNRDEIVSRLGIQDKRADRMSDSALLLAAWERWEVSCIDYLLGDFAFAAWQRTEERLVLIRSPLAMKSLFYCQKSGFMAFASLPSALHGLAGVPREIDLEEAAAIAGGDALGSQATLFKGISRVLPGHAVILTHAGERSFRIWQLENSPPPASLAEAGEAVRAEFERAVAARLRRRSGPITAHLSSGRDSSAVTTTAARLLATSGEQLIAITAAPRRGFDEGIHGSQLPDESGIAAVTAAAYPNIVHRICRSEPVAVGPLFDLCHRDHFGPMLNTYNAGWWLQTLEEANRHGSTVLLTGQMGNFSISRGGFDALVDVLTKNGLPAWWRVARSMVGQSRISWHGAANLSLGPWLPRQLHAALLRVAGRRDISSIELPLLRGEFRARAEQISRARFYDGGPNRSFREKVASQIYRADHSDEFGIARWGIEVRDPTADRRLIQLCHSLSPDQLVSPQSPRPAYQAAFGDRVPAAVIDGRRRGFQSADWFETFRPEELRTALFDYAANPLVAALFDVDKADEMLDGWPKSGGSDRATIGQYGQELLNSIALMNFIAIHFPA